MRCIVWEQGSYRTEFQDRGSRCVDIANGSAFVENVPNRMPRRQRPLCRIEGPDLKNRTEVFHEMLNNYLRLRVFFSLEIVQGDVQMIRTSLYELQHGNIKPRGPFDSFFDMLCCQQNSYLKFECF